MLAAIVVHLERGAVSRHEQVAAVDRDGPGGYDAQNLNLARSTDEQYGAWTKQRVAHVRIGRCRASRRVLRRRCREGDPRAYRTK
jgi:hypothetical protein